MGGGGSRGGSQIAHRTLRRAFRAYVEWVLLHPRLVVIAATALTAFWASQLPALRVEIDPDANLPQDHEYIHALHVLETTFGEKNLLVIGLFPTDHHVFTPRFLATLERITNRIRDLPGLVRSSYLSLASPLAKSIEGRDDAVVVERVLDRIPTTRAEADEVRRRAYLNPFYRGIIVADDASATALIANFKLTPEMPSYPEVYERVARVLREETDGTFSVHLGGPISVLAGVARVTERTVLLFPIAMLIIAIIHYEAFRTFQAMILPLVTALLSVLWALGLMGFLRIPLDPFNTTTPILVLAVAAGHAVQLLKRYYEEFERHQDARRAVEIAMLRLAPVMVTAGLIGALSFFSLTVFGTATIRNFGLLTGFGILAALLIELTLIPAIRLMLRPPHGAEMIREARSGRLLERGLTRLARLVAERPRAVVALAAGIALLSLYGAARIRVDTRLKRQFRTTDPVRVDDDTLNAAFAGTNTLVLIVTGPADESLATANAIETIRDLQKFVEANATVGATSSVADVILEMNRALHGDDSAGRMTPPSDDLVRQCFFLYSLSGDPTDLDDQIDPEHRTAAIRVFMKSDSTEYSEHLITRIKAYAAQRLPRDYSIAYSGSNASNAALTEVMVRGKLLNMLQIAVIIVLVSGVILGTLVGGLFVAAPLLMAVLVNLGVMGLVGIPLDIITAPIAAMAVGIGADYAIYFMFRFREELAVSGTPALALASALRTSGKAIVYVSSAIAGGYLALLVSGFVYHTELGMMVGVAMIVSSFASISLLPALLLIVRPRFLFGYRRAL